MWRSSGPFLPVPSSASSSRSRERRQAGQASHGRGDGPLQTTARAKRERGGARLRRGAGEQIGGVEPSALDAATQQCLRFAGCGRHGRAESSAEPARGSGEGARFAASGPPAHTPPMLPLRDDVPSRSTPFVVVCLIVANAAVFLLELSLAAGDGEGAGALAEFTDAWGLVPREFLRGA